MDLHKKTIIYNDILVNQEANPTRLSSYKFYEEDNITWLYTPLIVRPENLNMISFWSYILNEDSILSSQINILGEIKINIRFAEVYVDNEFSKKHINKIEDIIMKNKNMFPEILFNNQLEEALDKYHFEIIVQQEGSYRLRIRPHRVDEIIYDLFYCAKSDKLKFNILNPEL